MPSASKASPGFDPVASISSTFGTPTAYPSAAAVAAFMLPGLVRVTTYEVITPGTNRALTHIVTARTRCVMCHVQGGGGSGRGISGTAGQFQSAAGGGAGGFASFVHFPAAAGASYAVTVGAGGIGVAGGNGVAGGDSIVTCPAPGLTVFTARGGGGATGVTTAATTSSSYGGSGGTVTPAPGFNNTLDGGLLYSANGQPGAAGWRDAIGTGVAISVMAGRGGDSLWGRGGIAPTARTSANGNPGTGYGGGGGGAEFWNVAPTVLSGGAGSPGFVTFFEYGSLAA